MALVQFLSNLLCYPVAKLLAIGPFEWNIIYVVGLVVLTAVYLTSWYHFLLLRLPVLNTLIVSGLIETKNRTLEETGILFDGNHAKAAPVVSATQNNSTRSTHSSEEGDKTEQVFREYVIGD